jgi:hypothetical protein
VQGFLQSLGPLLPRYKVNGIVDHWVAPSSRAVIGHS